MLWACPKDPLLPDLSSGDLPPPKLPAGDGWMSTCKKLIWQDEFNGSALDPARWSHDQGYGQSGWGNDEYQKYTKGNRNRFAAFES